MKRLGTVKIIVSVLLMVSIFVVILFAMKYNALIDLFALDFSVWNVSAAVVIELIAIIQCINLSIALYILYILDKHLIPIY